MAGLAAIGAARALGAIVRAFDVRPAVKTEVESMGAEFLEVDYKESGEGEGGYAKVMSEGFLKAEMELFHRQAKEVDIIITTAQIPNKRAPLLIQGYMVDSMKSGSVVVDLAASSGGNCQYTFPDEAYTTPNGVTIIGYSDLASRMPGTASQLYSSNLCHLLDDMGRGEKFTVNLEDEVVRTMMVTQNGVNMWPAPKKAAPKSETKEAVVETKKVEEPSAFSKWWKAQPAIVHTCASWFWGFLFFATVAVLAPPAFKGLFMFFIISCALGYYVIWDVTPVLHTPLMSVTNAISGIVILSCFELVQGSLNEPHSFGAVLAWFGIFFSAVNVIGGFAVTDRMLLMYKKDD